MFEIGDKLICKDSFKSPFDNLTLFLKESQYKILYKTGTVLKIGNDQIDYYFSIDNAIKHFFTIKEIRKLKLERLKNV